jgi:hypothetical protein
MWESDCRTAEDQLTTVELLRPDVSKKVIEFPEKEDRSKPEEVTIS